MGLDRIVCLANSYKHGHRCVAGISLVTGKWVRLVGRQVAGCLTVKETSYPDGRQAAMLDMFEVDLGQACGSNSHPEDVLVTAKPWRPVRRFDEPADVLFLERHVSRGPMILQGCGDRIDVGKVEETPVERSLELIRPDDLWWWIREDRGKRKNRALFRLGHDGRVRYDLAVTDPVWLDQLNFLPVGIHSHALLCGGKPLKPLFTMSLSEPFDGFHYKLVAGVANLSA
jgi:hypothetical protein